MPTTDYSVLHNLRRDIKERIKALSDDTLEAAFSLYMLDEGFLEETIRQEFHDRGLHLKRAGTKASAGHTWD